MLCWNEDGHEPHSHHFNADSEIGWCQIMLTAAIQVEEGWLEYSASNEQRKAIGPQFWDDSAAVHCSLAKMKLD